MVRGRRPRLRIGCPASPWAGLRDWSRLAARRQPGGGAGGSPPANGRAAPEQLQRAGARPPRRREVGRGRACSGEAAAGPDRATGGGGGTMEAAAAAPRPRLLLLVLAAAATLAPGATGERRRGRAGGRLRGARAGPGLWLATSLSQTWRGAGGAGGGAGPGPGWPGLAAATRITGGERGRGGAGRGRVSGRGWTCRAAGGRPCSQLPGGGGVGRSGPRAGLPCGEPGGAGRGPEVVCGRPGLEEPGCLVALSGHPTPSGRVARGSRGPGRGWGRRRFPGRGMNSEPAERWEGATCGGDPRVMGVPWFWAPARPRREGLFPQPGLALGRGSREALCEKKEARRCAECFFFGASGKC